MHLFLFNNVELKAHKTSLIDRYIVYYAVELRGTYTDNRLFGVAHNPRSRFCPYHLCNAISLDKFMCAEDAPEMG